MRIQILRKSLVWCTDHFTYDLPNGWNHLINIINCPKFKLYLCKNIEALPCMIQSLVWLFHQASWRVVGRGCMCCVCPCDGVAACAVIGDEQRWGQGGGHAGSPSWREWRDRWRTSECVAGTSGRSVCLWKQNNQRQGRELTWGRGRCSVAWVCPGIVGIHEAQALT